MYTWWLSNEFVSYLVKCMMYMFTYGHIWTPGLGQQALHIPLLGGRRAADKSATFFSQSDNVTSTCQIAMYKGPGRTRNEPHQKGALCIWNGTSHFVFSQLLYVGGPRRNLRIIIQNLRKRRDSWTPHHLSAVQFCHRHISAQTHDLTKASIFCDVQSCSRIVSCKTNIRWV